MTREQRANAANDILSAVGWQDVLYPELARLREQLRDAAIASTLGQPHPFNDTTPTALAAMAWASDQMIRILEKTVGKGAPPERGETLAAVQERLQHERTDSGSGRP